MIADDAVDDAQPQTGAFAHLARGEERIEDARQMLGVECPTTLDEMLDEVIPWIRQAVDEGRI